MTGGIPGPLGGLLGKLGLLGRGGAGKAEGGAAAQGLKAEAGAEGAPGLPKGALLGDDGALLAGLGYAGADRHTAQRNVAERSAVAKFLHELGEDAHAGAPAPALGEAAAREARPEGERAEGRAERPAEDAQATRREEKGEELRGQAREEATKETRREREAEEAEARRERDPEERDDDDAHGQGWVAEEQEAEDGPKRRRGLREGEVLGEGHRCRGTLEDGARCLRKPSGGSAYCREHAALRLPPRPERA